MFIIIIYLFSYLFIFCSDDSTSEGSCGSETLTAFDSSGEEDIIDEWEVIDEEDEILGINNKER